MLDACRLPMHKVTQSAHLRLLGHRHDRDRVNHSPNTMEDVYCLRRPPLYACSTQPMTAMRISFRTGCNHARTALVRTTGDDGNDDDTADARLVLLAFCTPRLVSMTESTIEYVLWIWTLIYVSWPTAASVWSQRERSEAFDGLAISIAVTVCIS